MDKQLLYKELQRVHSFSAVGVCFTGALIASALTVSPFAVGAVLCHCYGTVMLMLCSYPVICSSDSHSVIPCAQTLHKNRKAFSMQPYIWLKKSIYYMFNDICKCAISQVMTTLSLMDELNILQRFFHSYIIQFCDDFVMQCFQCFECLSRSLFHPKCFHFHLQTNKTNQWMQLCRIAMGCNGLHSQHIFYWGLFSEKLRLRKGRQLRRFFVNNTYLLIFQKTPLK